MINDLFSVFAGVSKKEIEAMIKLNVISIKGRSVLGRKGETLLSLFDLVCLDKERTCARIDHIEIDRIVKMFRQDVIDCVFRDLIGVEIKRPCQYNREWVKAIVTEIDGGIYVISTNKSKYNVDKVKLYETEENAVSLYTYAASLLVDSDN